MNTRHQLTDILDPIIYAAASYQNIVAVTATGKLYVRDNWLLNRDDPIYNMTELYSAGVMQVVILNEFLYVRLENGTVEMWGNGKQKELKLPSNIFVKDIATNRDNLLMIGDEV